MNTAIPCCLSFDDYLECALWSSSCDDDTPFDQVDAHLAPETVTKMRLELADFADLLEKDGITEIPLSEQQISHDFWLTRNEHGAGFWDRGIGKLGDKLSDIATSTGPANLYLGDDGLIYQD